MINEMGLPSGHTRGAPVTIAVIELVGGEPLERCIRRAVDEAKSTQSYVLVICRALSNTVFENLGYDRVMAIENAGDSVLERRLVAFHRSNTDILALIEDTTCPPAAVVEELQNRFMNDSIGAVWGPIRISSDLPASDRALGFLDYGRFASEKSSRDDLPGNCLIIRKSHLAIPECAAAIEMMEGKIAAQLMRKGKQICFSDELTAVYETRDRYNSSLMTRFHHGRFYAGERYSHASSLVRIAGCIRAVAVPLVLSMRGISSVTSQSPKRRWLAEIFWVMVMSAATAAGEGVGAVFGGGNSQEMWR